MITTNFLALNTYKRNMSIIAVKNVPYKWSIPEVLKKLTVAIKGPFEVLNFEVKKNQPTKVCYVRLSARLDPVRIVENINNYSFPKLVKLFAFVPENIPDLPLAKKRIVPRRYRQSAELPELLEPHQVAILVHEEILKEMQAKYPELYNLSLKTGHKLLNELAKIVFERLKTIIDANIDVSENCFRLSQFYRKMHPHFGDFQLILSTLHKLQDASGAPRMQLNESELAKFEPKPYSIGDVPYPKVQKFCNSLNNKIYESIKKHVNSWETDEDKDEETDARNKVRQEIKKIVPYMPTILQQLSTKHMMPEDVPHHRVTIYGEPFMPNKNLMAPFIKRYTSSSPRVIRSNRMYNVIRFQIPQKSYLALAPMDGTVLHGAKLIIRNEMPTYKTPEHLKKDMLRSMGVAGDLDTVQFADEAELDDHPPSDENDDDDDEDEVDD